MNIGSFSSPYQTTSLGPQIRSDPVDMNPKMSSEDRNKLGMISVMQDEPMHRTMTRYVLHRDASLHGTPMVDGLVVDSVDDYVNMLYTRAELSGGKDSFGVSSQRYANLIDVRV